MIFLFLNGMKSINTASFLISIWIEKLALIFQGKLHWPTDRLETKTSQAGVRMTLWFCLQRHFRVGFCQHLHFLWSFQNPGTFVTSEAMKLLQFKAY